MGVQNNRAHNIIIITNITIITMPEVDRPDYVMWEMVLEEAKRKNRKLRPNSANSILNLEDIKTKLQAAEARRKTLEHEQLALLEAKKRRGEEVRAKKMSEGDKTQNSQD